MAESLRATAYWTIGPRRGELRDETLAPPGPGQVLVRTLHSAVSRGTERLVHRGEVPPEIATAMRAPFQVGDFPWPVKYGYLSVGIVEDAPDSSDGFDADTICGRAVFCLYPHQDRYVVPRAAVTPVPDGVPARRAVLAGTVETAVNAVWDAAPRLGDRIAVVGAGLVGCTVAAVLRSFPLDRLQLVDVDPSRAAVASALGVPLVHPDEAHGDCNVVIHASATSAGLRRSLELLDVEGEVVELSWYGTTEVGVPLGSVFHQRRLGIRASQVSEVAAARRATRSHADRLELALDLLHDAAFDAIIAGSSPFAELPVVMDGLDDGRLPGPCHLIDYETDDRAEEPPSSP